jgi:hypothetical protein
MRRQVFPTIHGVFDEHRTSHPDQGSGSWGDLSTARHLRDTAPELEVVLLKKNPLFWSCPLSNRWLVVSTGIRVSYEPWFGNDRQAIAYTNTHYSSAYVPSAEHLSLKQKIYALKGGTIVMTLPTPPHRCPPSTYERACLMANHFQKHKIPAKIVLLDPNPAFPPSAAASPWHPRSSTTCASCWSTPTPWWPSA